MLTITLRDLQFRKRQFAIAVIGAGLTFALALLLTGVRSGFDTEANETVDAAGAAGWLVREGVRGPFTSISTLPEDTVRRVRAAPGVDDAEPMVIVTQSMDSDGELIGVNVIGVVPGGLGAPAPTEGSALAGRGEAIVGRGTDAEIGDEIVISGRPFKVVGSIPDRSIFAGQPVVYVTLEDAQAVAFQSEPVASTIVFTGSIDDPPPGLVALSNEAVEEDLKQPVDGAIGAIDLLRVLMWLVAAVIIGAVVYLSALERLTDFAVLKAVGARSGALAVGVSLQALIASLLAAALAAAIAALLQPSFPMPVTIGAGSYLAMVAIAALVGVLTSLAALRKVLNVDPGLAFS